MGDSISTIAATAAGTLLTGAVAFVGVIIKRYADSILNNSDILNKHSLQMAEMSIELDKMKKDIKNQAEDLTISFNRLKADMGNVSLAIEGRTKQLEQGLTFVMKLRSELDEMHGSISHNDKRIEGLTIRADTQHNSLAKAALAMAELKKKQGG